MVKNVLSVALCFFLKACVNIRLKDLVNLVHKRRKMVFFNCGKRVCLLKWSANECGKTQQHAYVGATYVWLYCILYDYEYIYIYTCIHFQERSKQSPNQHLDSNHSRTRHLHRRCPFAMAWKNLLFASGERIAQPGLVEHWLHSRCGDLLLKPARTVSSFAAYKCKSGGLHTYC